MRSQKPTRFASEGQISLYCSLSRQYQTKFEAVFYVFHKNNGSPSVSVYKNVHFFSHKPKKKGKIPILPRKVCLLLFTLWSVGMTTGGNLGDFLLLEICLLGLSMYLWPILTGNKNQTLPNSCVVWKTRWLLGTHFNSKNMEK